MVSQSNEPATLTPVKYATAMSITLMIAACGSDPAPIDKLSVCSADPSLMSQASQSLALQDRKVIGAAAPYQADLSMSVRDSDLQKSMRSRREMAWQVVERALSPVPIGEPKLSTQLGHQLTIPAWHSWYGKDDFERIFKKLYKDQGIAARKQRAPFAASTIADGIAWNANALDDLATTSWPEQRYLDYLANATTDDHAHGFAGISRVSYAPATVSHLLSSYQTMLACRETEPAPYVMDAMERGRAVANAEDVQIEQCGWTVKGPFLTAADAAFAVTSSGDGDADIYVRRGQAPDMNTYDCKSDGNSSSENCEVPGGGPIYVGVFGAKPSAVRLELSYRQSDVRKPACLTAEMPRDAVLVKADWKRAQFNEPFPIFDTSGRRMAARLSAAGGDDWGPGDGQASPSANDAYTVTLPNNNTFRLAALHIMTKELDHWVWVTLWWSGNEPNADFGQDRPASVAALPGPWRNYKMCVATDYVEGDADPRGGFAGSLGDALSAVYRGHNSPTWCSNPYIEAGPKNANTNCIGCHQHGGTNLTALGILNDFPAAGSTHMRNNFFTDYLWSIRGGGGEDLTAVIKSEVDFWDAGE
jgi:hypothetical protein